MGNNWPAIWPANHKNNALGAMSIVEFDGRRDKGDDVRPGEIVIASS